MASIDKLSIRGVRSFSPNREEIIEFKSPLTMIVGANGCGKTTVIESLKYACTGTLPPGARSGQSFINDPAMTESSEVKAAIKLRCNNKAGQAIVVVRSLQLTKKKGKLEFKALDGVVRTTNQAGEKFSTSYKCTELDKHVPEILGVSPAIMENVIFCHQEDSNWPMQEGLQLKKKFDDVFESTRYARALDAILKTKKDYTAKGKDLKAELMEFGAHLHAANDAKRELASSEDNFARCERELSGLEEELDQNEEKLQRCESTINKAEGKLTALKDLQRKVEDAERRLADKSSSLEQPMEESDEELKSMLDNFESQMQSRRQKLMELQRAVDGLNSSISKLRSKTDELNTQKGQATALRDQLKQLRADVAEKAQQIARKHGLPAPQLPSASGAAASAAAAGDDAFIHALKDFINALDAKVQQTREENETTLREAQRVVDTSDKAFSEARSQVQRYDLELDNRRRELDRASADMEKKRTELSTLVSAKAALQQAERDEVEARQRHDEFMGSYQTKAADFKSKIKEMSDRIRDLTDQIATDAALLQELNLNRNEILAVNAMEKQLAQDFSQISIDVSTTLRAHRDILASVRDQIPASGAGAASASASVSASASASAAVAGDWKLQDVAPALDALMNLSVGKKSQLSTKRDALDRVRRDLSGTNALLQQEQGRLRTAKEKISKLEDISRDQLHAIVHEIMQFRNSATMQEEYENEPPITADMPIGVIVEAAVSSQAKASEYRIVLDACVTFRKRIDKRRTKKGGACPCCEQAMNADVAAKYEANIDVLFAAKADISTQHIEQVEASITATAIRAKDLQQELQPLNDLKIDVEDCEDRIKGLEEKKADLSAQDAALSDEVDQLDATVTATDRAIQALNELHYRHQGLQNRESELADKKRRQSQSMLSSDLEGRSIDTIESQQKDRQEEKDALITKKDRAVAEEGQLVKAMNQVKLNLMEREKALNEAKQRGTRQLELEEQVTGLQKQIGETEAERKTLVRERDDFSRQQKAAETELTQARKVLKDQENMCNIRLSNVTKDREDVQRAIESLENLHNRLEKAALPTVERNLEKCQGEIAEKEELIRTHTPQITAINSEISLQERTKRLVKDNLDFREASRNVEAVRKDMQKVEREIGGDGGRELKDAQRELQRCMQTRERLRGDCSVLEGKMEIYQKQQEELQQKLNGPNYRGIEDRYRRKSIEYETTILAVADLGSYYDALDKALQNFHTLKIKEINKIIRELWQLIYKGQDIDGIELESGHDLDGTGAAVSASETNRRQYNYRVVMRKGDTPLDMRGRCSAGQRVLAAIVIRLALAETFCLNCGILALDEPTTNLDEANKAGLAHALAQIIISRSRQLNFQLICITHDEDFVKMISQELSASPDFALPEHFWRIAREEDAGNGKFFSRIERVLWQDM